MSVNEASLEFWSKALGLPRESFARADFEISHTGLYLERSAGKLIYFFEDLTTGKRILASHSEIAADLSGVSSFDLREHPFFAAMELVHCDTDYFLDSVDSLIVDDALDIRVLDGAGVRLVDAFYSDCSEKERDILDLNLGQDFALGIFVREQLAGIARYISLRQSPLIADITVAVGISFRGRGLAAPVISALVREILGAGLIPRYRVEDGNDASIAVAKRLGFVAKHRVLAFRGR